MKQDTVTGQSHGENYCYYYLHTNGDLIHKSKHSDPLDFEESDLVKKWWAIDLENRLAFIIDLVRSQQQNKELFANPFTEHQRGLIYKGTLPSGQL